MMFLNYVVWGAWYVTINTYLTQTLKFSGTEAGAVFGTSALACMISPFLVGLIADRYFASERVLGSLHLIGAVLLYLVSTATTFTSVYLLMLAYCLCFFPTLALTNTLTLRNVANASTDFPRIRLFATLGHIAVNQVIGGFGLERSSMAFLISAGASVVMGLYSFSLPHTPPKAKDEAFNWRSAIGFDALVMMKDRTFAVFVIASVLACIPLAFYFSFTNAYLNEVGVVNAAGKMTLGQVSEVLMMLAMPFIFRALSLKWILLLGLASWSLRYAMLAYGNAGDLMWLLYGAILLHGICYDFFFMTGQIYTDQEAPAHLRGTAQGLVMFLTYGVGMFLGSLFSGWTIDSFTVGEVRNWKAFWLSSAALSTVILLLLAVFFRSSKRIRTTTAS
ncbi:putative nucleoside transporter YegT [Bryobacterales bacterium F-183]|nr:putative nucleoside transporter YegT [Bryobacterales bacterium F-183]